MRVNIFVAVLPGDVCLAVGGYAPTEKGEASKEITKEIFLEEFKEELKGCPIHEVVVDIPRYGESVKTINGKCEISQEAPTSDDTLSQQERDDRDFQARWDAALREQGAGSV